MTGIHERERPCIDASQMLEADPVRHSSDRRETIRGGTGGAMEETDGQNGRRAPRRLLDSQRYTHFVLFIFRLLSKTANIGLMYRIHIVHSASLLVQGIYSHER